MKLSAANVDAFSVGSAICCRTDECNLLWIGGFCPSVILKVILPQLQNLCSHRQLSDILKFRKSCEQAEHALSQGMEKLHQIHAKATAAAAAGGDKGFQVMHVSQLVSFIKQADHLRQEFLRQFARLLTISQQAQILLSLGVEHSQEK